MGMTWEGVQCSNAGGFDEPEAEVELHQPHINSLPDLSTVSYSARSSNAEGIKHIYVMGDSKHSIFLKWSHLHMKLRNLWERQCFLWEIYSLNKKSADTHLLTAGNTENFLCICIKKAIKMINFLSSIHTKFTKCVTSNKGASTLVLRTITKKSTAQSPPLPHITTTPEER
jgi:hypothetical protein